MGYCTVTVYGGYDTPSWNGIISSKIGFCGSCGQKNPSRMRGPGSRPLKLCTMCSSSTKILIRLFGTCTICINIIYLYINIILYAWLCMYLPLALTLFSWTLAKWWYVPEVKVAVIHFDPSHGVFHEVLLVTSNDNSLDAPRWQNRLRDSNKYGGRWQIHQCTWDEAGV